MHSLGDVEYYFSCNLVPTPFVAQDQYTVEVPVIRQLDFRYPDGTPNAHRDIAELNVWKTRKHKIIQDITFKRCITVLPRNAAFLADQKRSEGCEILAAEHTSFQECFRNFLGKFGEPSLIEDCVQFDLM